MKSPPEEEMKSIELDISDDVLLKLAMQAHERNVTLNTHIIDVIKDKLKDTESTNLRMETNLNSLLKDKLDELKVLEEEYELCKQVRLCIIEI